MEDLEDEFDYVVVGTGLSACVLSGLLSARGARVLHTDPRGHYGGESASVNIQTLFAKFAPAARDAGDTLATIHTDTPAEPPATCQPFRDWSIDLTPKFVMADGLLVKLLLYTGVTRYLEWQAVAGTYVYQPVAAGWVTAARALSKVPTTEKEILLSPLMPLMEKNRCRQFFAHVARNFDAEGTPLTETGRKDIGRSARAVFKDFGLGPDTVDFIGHAVALRTSDAYLDEPCERAWGSVRLYIDSMLRYGKSPFIYPLYGLGGLPEAFSRLSAVYGGVYMLNTKVLDVQMGVGRPGSEAKREEGEAKPEEGGVDLLGLDAKPSYPHMVEIEHEGERKKIYAKKVILGCDEAHGKTWGEGWTRARGAVTRAVLLLKALPEDITCESAQVIFPQKQLGTDGDVFVTVLGAAHGVAPAGRSIAIVSTAAGVGALKAALDIFAPFELARFVATTPLLEPEGPPADAHCVPSLDATSHFAETSRQILQIYRDITGENLDLSHENLKKRQAEYGG